MASKYIDVSATFNGDGTSPDPATTDGGVGAWNDFVASCSGTPAYGTLDAGDTVFIRTHDGTSDLGATLAADFTFADGSSVSAVTRFQFDNGSIWPQGGLFTLTCGNGGVTVPGYASVNGSNKNLLLDKSGATADDSAAISCSGVLSSFSFVGADSYYSHIYIPDGVIINGHFDFGGYDSGDAMFRTTSYGCARLVNPCIDLSRLPNSSSVVVFGYTGGTSYGSAFGIYGGAIVGGQELMRLYKNETYDRKVGFYMTGFDIGPLTEIDRRRGAFSIVANIPKSFADFILPDYEGTVQWREGLNYPTLNAVLPDGNNTPWSYRVAPTTVAGGSRPLILPPMRKWYDLAPATKTIKANILLSEDFAGATGNEIFMTFQYEGDDGVIRTVDTVQGGALSPSTAAWSETFYGAKSFSRHELIVTTPTAIKQNSFMQAQIFFCRTANTVDEYMFVCPEIIVE